MICGTFALFRSITPGQSVLKCYWFAQPKTVTNRNTQLRHHALFPLQLRRCTSQRIAATTTWPNAAVLRSTVTPLRCARTRPSKKQYKYVSLPLEKKFLPKIRDMRNIRPFSEYHRRSERCGVLHVPAPQNCNKPEHAAQRVCPVPVTVTAVHVDAVDPGNQRPFLFHIRRSDNRVHAL